MAAPTLSSSSPADAATGVFLNTSITATFDTTLLSSSVNSSTVVLRSSTLNEVIDADITVSGAVITITPWSILIANSTYTLTLIGADLGLSTGAIQSSTSDDLATTVVITFQTGAQLQTTFLAKTDEEVALEGDAFLPTELTFTNITGFKAINSTPSNHQWNVSETKSQIIVTFSSAIDTGSVVDGTSFIVSQYAFLDEEGLLAVTGANGYTFQQDNTGLNFSDVTGSVEVDNTQVLWTKDVTRNWLRNTCVEVFLGSTIAGANGTTLGQDQKITFYIEPYPNIVGVRALKNELGTLLPSTYLDDYLGLRLWMRTIETHEELGSLTALSGFSKNRSFKEYIRCRTALDIIEDIRGEKDLGAGTSKVLGDFRVSYFPAGADAQSRKEISLEKTCDKAWRAMVGYMNRPAVTIKGEGGVVTRGSRAWRLPISHNNVRNVLVSDPIPAANTSRERDRKVPGFGDPE